MSRLAHTIRFLVGLAMVAGGVTLAAPLATRLAATVATARARQTGPPPAFAPVAVPGGAPGAMPPPAAAIDTGFVPAAPPPTEPPSAAVSFEPVPAAVGPAFVPRADYQPPPPPAPLPPLPTEFARPQPRLGNAYRSMLDVPPPPLLDGGAPPPLAVGWSQQEAARPAAVGPSVQPPATYRVRDGDDLAGIASRFYGHPAAAAGIWSANRHAIQDPDLLPIGADLVLPPPWDLGIGTRGGGPSIEPAAAALPVAPASSAAGGLVPAAPAWLTSAGAAPGPQAAPPAAAGGRAGSVRVGPGETLATLATRFYGDAGMAGRIFEANRDRLRSPDLVVPGMELRLP